MLVPASSHSFRCGRYRSLSSVFRKATGFAGEYLLLWLHRLCQREVPRKKDFASSAEYPTVDEIRLFTDGGQVKYSFHCLLRRKLL